MNPAWIIKDDRPSVRLMRGFNCALLFGALVANLTHPALAQDCAADLGKLQGTYSSGDVGVIAAAATAFRDAGDLQLRNRAASAVTGVRSICPDGPGGSRRRKSG